jgi:holdfast attachment protein HfaA
MAQTAPSSLSSVEAGYGGARSIETTRFSASTRDANGNRVVLNGVIQQGSANSSLTLGGPTAFGAGADFFSAGAAGNASATAAGNLLTVTVTGSGNTLIIDNQQTNSGAVKAVAAVGASVTSAQDR